MTTMTIDTLNLVDKLESAGFNRDQAAVVMRAIAESQDELVTKQDLDKLIIV